MVGQRMMLLVDLDHEVVQVSVLLVGLVSMDPF
jgi:hypothetical protein